MRDNDRPDPAATAPQARETNTADADARARRARRRNRPQRVFDTSVPSPCIAVCQVDPKTSLCIGCFRSIDEIRDWPILSADEKRSILTALPARR